MSILNTAMHCNEGRWGSAEHDAIITKQVKGTAEIYKIPAVKILRTQSSKIACVKPAEPGIAA